MPMDFWTGKVRKVTHGLFNLGGHDLRTAPAQLRSAQFNCASTQSQSLKQLVLRVSMDPQLEDVNLALADISKHKRNK